MPGGVGSLRAQHPLALLLEGDEEVAREPTLEMNHLVVQTLEVARRARA